jgi:hypothetical protein
LRTLANTFFLIVGVSRGNIFSTSPASVSQDIGLVDFLHLTTRPARTRTAILTSMSWEIW